MAGKWERHVLAAPVIAPTAPFLGAGALRLRRIAIVEIKAGIALKCVQIRLVREDQGCADEAAGPVSAAFGSPRVQEQQIAPFFRMRMIAIGCMEIADVVGCALIARERE